MSFVRRSGLVSLVALVKWRLEGLKSVAALEGLERCRGLEGKKYFYICECSSLSHNVVNIEAESEESCYGEITTQWARP